MQFFQHLSLPLLSVLVLLFLLHSPTANGDDALSQICGTTNFTANSTYQSNLNVLLSSLTKNSSSSTSKAGYASGTVGSIPDRISGLVFCRGDINSSTCSSCVTQATQDVQNLCPYTKEVTIYYDFCLLRYSYQQFLTSTDQSNEERLLENTQNVTRSVTGFDDLVMILTNSTAEYASENSSIKFGTAEMMNYSTSFPMIYSLVHCIPDLSDSDCLGCLQDLFNLFTAYFSGRQGARILGWRCNVIYEIYDFYNGVSMLKLTPPAEITPAPAPSLFRPVINPTTGERRTRRSQLRRFTCLKPIDLPPLLPLSLFVVEGRAEGNALLDGEGRVRRRYVVGVGFRCCGWICTKQTKWPTLNVNRFIVSAHVN